jgi:1-deoxy-D-xylulose-5-phosphate synthase
MQLIPIGKGRKLNDGNSDIAILSIGNIGTTVTKAIKLAQAKGIDVAHYDMIFLKPIDEDILREVASKYRRIITVENGTIVGGLGSTVMEWMNDNGYSPRIKRVGIPDRFIAQGTVAELHKLCGMDTDSIATLLTTNW